MTDTRTEKIKALREYLGSAADDLDDDELLSIAKGSFFEASLNIRLAFDELRQSIGVSELGKFSRRMLETTTERLNYWVSRY